MFELMNEYELNIINQIYFKDVKNRKKLNEKDNKFYDDGTKEYFGFFGYYNENKNGTHSVSIF